MLRSLSRHALIGIFCALACAISCYGQVATGTPPFGSFGGGPDVVNLANLNANLTIPIRNKAGRGTSFSYNLGYDSSIWQPVLSGGSKFWEPAGQWGWQGLQPAGETYVTYAMTYTSGQCGSGGDSSYQEWSYGDFQYFDTFGAAHPFAINGQYYSSPGGNNCPPNGPEPPSQDEPATAVASDGSGYTIYATMEQAGIGVYLTDKYGNKFNVAAYTTPPITGSTSTQDRNGNVISQTNGIYTDTLNTTALSVTGTAPSNTDLSYTAPSGATASYVVGYTGYIVRTAFGCSGITEYNSGTTEIYLVTSIKLPDSTTYEFTYEQTPGYSSDRTGRIASIKLPTGGTISYSYTGGSKGVVCADGSAATLTRTTPDGTWTYAHSESGTSWTTTVTDPQSNKSVLSFQGIYETEGQFYSPSDTLLKTVYTCYNGSAPNCNSTTITLPITQQSVYAVWPGSGGLESRTTTDYNGYGLLTEEDEYGYGAGTPGPLTRKTLTTYASLGNGIVGMPSSVTIENSSSAVIGQTTYTYDQGTVTTTSGTPQHVAITGSRGNATTVSYLVQSGTSLTRTYTYFDTGNVDVASGFNGAQTTYVYGDCGNSFATSVSEPLSLSKSMTWNCTGGVQTSVTGENGKSITYAYSSDPYFWRMNSKTDQEANVTKFTYTGQTSIESSMTFNSGGSTSDTLVTFDGLGRKLINQVKEAPSSSTYDSIETDYDSDGRPNRKTLPYSATSGQTNPSAPSKTTTYDGLGRRASVTDSGGGYFTYFYSEDDAMVEQGPAPPGENTKTRQHEYDSSGRLVSVCEITSLAGAGSCGQKGYVENGYLTTYTYNLLNQLTGVTQNAQSSNTQTRTYNYDGRNRKTFENNPETGPIYFFYDTDPQTKGSVNCPGTYDGDLVKVVDAMGNVTCFTYDARRRMTSATYSGPYASSTPIKHYVYDSATVNGVAMQNAQTQMAEAYTCVSPCTIKLTDVGFSYTARGEVSDVYESTPNSGGYYHVAASYWPNGALNQLSDLIGLPQITYNVDGKGRSYSVTDSSGKTLLASTAYNVADKATSIDMNSYNSDSLTYDPNTFRMTGYSVNVNGQSLVGALTWNAIGTLEDLKITDPFYSGGNESCSYTHDDLVRIASANCGSVWSQTFNYDAFGNLNKSGSMSFQPTYSYLTNQMTQIGSSNPTYDANGNVTNDFLHAYAWDASGRPVTIDGVGATYDALGRMVEQHDGGSYTQIVYAPTKAKLGIMSGQTLIKAFVRLAGHSKAIYNSGGLAYYRHPDWIGSSRFASTPSGTLYYDGAYAPFGEPYAQTGTTDLSFTGMNQDTVPNLYDFPAREYGIQGRWPSPDPAGLSAVQPRDPQTLNRYAYARNTPLVVTDPTGADDCFDDDDSDGGCDGGGGGGGGGGSGCDPSDPTCGGGGSGCDPSDPTCGGGGSGCDPSDPTCGSGGSGCDPSDPTCGSGGSGCDPSDPSCSNSGTCTPGDPSCADPVPICDPENPTCGSPSNDCDPSSPSCSAAFAVSSNKQQCFNECRTAVFVELSICIWLPPPADVLCAIGVAGEYAVCMIMCQISN